MTDYIYGYRNYQGTLYVQSNFTEEEVRRFEHQEPIRIPVSAIEPLPEPKPVLPTTPGSVVRGLNAIYLLTDEGKWLSSNSQATYSPQEVANWQIEFVFDAGAHEEGKTS